ncbi:MAG: prolyl oligopeptidase family serine peptidase [Crocinitomicaceae bacterium]|nr:prolyl oligopeptidase family serine peptidase [Crocinitomicaceae bacterium]
MKKLIIVPLLFILSLNVSAQSKALTNETIWKDYAFYNESVSGVRSMNDGENYTSLFSDPKSGMTTIKKFPYNSESQPESIIDLSALIFVGSEGKKRIKINDYQFNADETKILLATEQESIYRHSTKAYYYVYDIETKKIAELSESSKGKQRLAQFAPLGNKVAFVRENNIFITDLDEKQEIQITSGGKMNEMIFGATDWVYEEEFSFDNGLYWSPDGRKIAYYYFDESKVKQFQLAMYDGLYPSQYEFKYPKAGEDNSVVQVFVYELSSKRTSAFDTGIDTDIYLPRIKWTNDPDVLMVTRMNRLQNKLELMIGDFDETRPNNTGVRTKVIYSEESETYIDITDNLIFLSDNKSFLWSSEKDGYNHLYRINLKDGSSSQLTSGKWDVTELVGVDEDNKLIYYLSAEESPMERDLFTIKLNGSSKKKISTRKGQNEVAFSKGFKYYINYHSDANSPYYITLNNSTGEELKTLKDNQRVKDAMNTYGFVEKEFIKIKTKEGIELNAYMMKPQEFKETHQHPVFMHVYGGPGINTVHDAWGGQNFAWFQLLTQKGYIVVSVDARGTGYRGRDFKHCTYLQLGKYETEDQIAAAKWLGDLPYVDKNRIGIFGWSYGGYMSSLCITKGVGTFKSAIAVAPVTNWRYYDNIYTERFMRTPQENGENYDVNSPINHIAELQGNYLLVHGSADDNVHYQNTMEMINALVNANKQFDLFIYPNKNHGIYGGNTRLHLYNKMTNFILDNL